MRDKEKSHAEIDAHQAQRQNERLVQTLTQAKEQIGALKEEVEKLTAPPASYGIFAGVNADGTVTVWTGGRKLKVNCHPGLDPQTLQPGQELILNEALNIIEAKAFEVQGEVVHFKEPLEGGRALTPPRADEERVAELAGPLAALPLKAGDPLLYDGRSGYVLERLPPGGGPDPLPEGGPDGGYAGPGG